MFNDKIKKESFWFKLHKTWGTDQYRDLNNGYTVSLCPYFWKGCLILAFYSLLAAFTLVVTSITLSVVFTLSVSPYTNIWLPDFMVVLSMICSWFILAGLSVFGLTELLPKSIKGQVPWIPTYISKYFPEWKAKEKKYRKMSKPEQPNILVQYIKAKKAKWCPLLELEDEDNK